MHTVGYSSAQFGLGDGLGEGDGLADGDGLGDGLGKGGIVGVGSGRVIMGRYARLATYSAATG